MKVKKYYTGGRPKGPRGNKKRRNIAPQNPRFLPSAQMVGTRPNPKPEEKEEKKKKPKLAGGRGRRGSFGSNRGGGINYGRGGGRGSRTASSCRAGNCP